MCYGQDTVTSQVALSEHVSCRCLGGGVTSHIITSHPINRHIIPSHHIASHRITSHRIMF